MLLVSESTRIKLIQVEIDRYLLDPEGSLFKMATKDNIFLKLSSDCKTLAGCKIIKLSISNTLVGETVDHRVILD
jgi:hypothetical protein